MFEEIKKRARLYDEWRAKVRVYDAPSLPSEAPLPPMGLYTSLLEGVAPERQGIPVLMHALLEQVARNLQV